MLNVSIKRFWRKGGIDNCILSVDFQDARAVEMYHGDFLAGFFVHGCPEFENWARDERDHLRRTIIERLRTLVQPWHNLPAQLTPFAGREIELAQFIDLMKSFCLITVTGPGGIGKTRLALECAARQVGRFPQAYFSWR